VKTTLIFMSALVWTLSIQRAGHTNRWTDTLIALAWSAVFCLQLMKRFEKKL